MKTIRKITTVILALGVLTGVSGCFSTLGIDAERLDTSNKQLADKVKFVTAWANFAADLRDRGVIDQRQADRVEGHLATALNALVETQRAISEGGDPSQAEDTLTRVDRTLTIVLDLLNVLAPNSTQTFLEEHSWQPIYS